MVKSNPSNVLLKLFQLRFLSQQTLLSKSGIEEKPSCFQLYEVTGRKKFLLLVSNSCKAKQFFVTELLQVRLLNPKEVQLVRNRLKPKYFISILILLAKKNQLKLAESLKVLQVKHAFSKKVSSGSELFHLAFVHCLEGEKVDV